MSEGAFNYVAIFYKSYTAAKSGIFTLTHVLVVSFAGKVRVNSIYPGWIDNNDIVYAGADDLSWRL